MTITLGQEHNQSLKHVSLTSSMETTMLHGAGTQSLNLMQPVVSHQSLDSSISPSASPPLGSQEASQLDLLHSSSLPSHSPVPTALPTHTSQTHVQIQPSTGVIVETSMPATNTVPEFLYQLTKMLTDNNRDIIEWSKGKIEVHNPHKLQSHVLNRYFRHSKFASFQRQLNYFGFRKLAGKGKMAPCSYVNDATTKDLGSLLLIKRKVGNEPNNTKNTKKRDRDDTPVDVRTHAAANPVLTSLFHPSSVGTASIRAPTVASQGRISSQPPNKSHQELARVAVGKGIRHGFSLSSSSKPAPLPTRPLSTPLPPAPQQQLTNSQNSSRASLSVGVQEGLTALESNYMSSLGVNHGGNDSMSGSGNPSIPGLSEAYFPGSLRHNDSLVDLAMIPYLEDSNEQSDSLPFAFIDFPWQDPNSSSS